MISARANPPKQILQKQHQKQPQKQHQHQHQHQHHEPMQP